MRIAFVGKGGSGKTTLAGAWVRFLVTHAIPVLACDADLNQHLREECGLAKSPAYQLGHHIPLIKSRLAHERTDLLPEQMTKSTTPTRGSRILHSLHDLIDIFPEFVIHEDGIHLMEVGMPEREDHGIRCYHGKTGALELLLNHFIEQSAPKTHVVTDMTAGIDAFASHLYKMFDHTVMAVEPTRKSLSVFKEYQARAASEHIPVLAIVNKCRTEREAEQMKKQLGTAWIGHIPFIPDSLEEDAQRRRAQIDEAFVTTGNQLVAM